MSYLEKLFDLKDKVVYVTGACGQLGTAICSAYRDAGAIVTGSDMKQGDQLNDITYEILDITKKPDVQAAFKKVVETHGRFDILINNAGVNTFDQFEKRKQEDFDWVSEVNLKGTFLCIQAYINLFDEHKLSSGNIVNIASIFGTVSPDYRNYETGDRKNSEVYGATKAGIIQMSKYYAVHLAQRGIRVNAVSPGGIFNDTNPQKEKFVQKYASRIPMGRMAKDTEMVGAILYLSSEAASYTTGQNLTVDGGMSSW